MFEVLVYIAASHGIDPRDVRRITPTDTAGLDRLLGILADELSRTGLGGDDQPNEAGNIIEELIDGVTEAVYGDAEGR